MSSRTDHQLSRVLTLGEAPGSARDEPERGLGGDSPAAGKVATRFVRPGVVIALGDLVDASTGEEVGRGAAGAGGNDADGAQG